MAVKFVIFYLNIKKIYPKVPPILQFSSYQNGMLQVILPVGPKWPPLYGLSSTGNCPYKGQIEIQLSG